MNPFELEFWLKVPIDGLEAGALMAGWTICNGAGLLEWDKMIHPPRKLKTDAKVSQTRKLFLINFIFNTFL
jgi:hypothetical protein